MRRAGWPQFLLFTRWSSRSIGSISKEHRDGTQLKGDRKAGRRHNNESIVSNRSSLVPSRQNTKRHSTKPDHSQLTKALLRVAPPQLVHLPYFFPAPNVLVDLASSLRYQEIANFDTRGNRVDLLRDADNKLKANKDILADKKSKSASKNTNDKFILCFSSRLHRRPFLSNSSTVDYAAGCLHFRRHIAWGGEDGSGPPGRAAVESSLSEEVLRVSHRGTDYAATPRKEYDNAADRGEQEVPQGVIPGPALLPPDPFIVVGCDEVGRGPLAGPLVCAATTRLLLCLRHASDDTLFYQNTSLGPFANGRLPEPLPVADSKRLALPSLRAYVGARLAGCRLADDPAMDSLCDELRDPMKRDKALMLLLGHEMSVANGSKAIGRPANVRRIPIPECHPATALALADIGRPHRLLYQLLGGGSRAGSLGEVCIFSGAHLKPGLEGYLNDEKNSRYRNLAHYMTHKLEAHGGGQAAITVPLASLSTYHAAPCPPSPKRAAGHQPFFWDGQHMLLQLSCIAVLNNHLIDNTNISASSLLGMSLAAERVALLAQAVRVGMQEGIIGGGTTGIVVDPSLILSDSPTRLPFFQRDSKERRIVLSSPKLAERNVGNGRCHDDHHHGLSAVALVDGIMAPHQVLVDRVRALIEEGISFEKGGAGPGVLYRALTKGDATSQLIAAASIMCKSLRDSIMCYYHHLYPKFGFNKHFGYPCPGHLRCVAESGLTPIHRRSYRPCQEACHSLSNKKGQREH